VLTAPTGTGGLSGDAWAVELPVIASRDFGAVELRGFASYTHVFANDAESELGFGVLASVSLAETFSIGVEMGRGATTEDFDAGEVWHGVGAQWEFAPGYELQARVGRVREGGEDGSEAAIFLQRAF
jgi:hypothetical protein